MEITPRQFNRLATKDDLKELEKRMATRKQVNDLTTSVDGLAKVVKDLKDEFKVQRLRIKAVEERVGIDY